MTDDPPRPLDLTASDALDAGAVDRLGPEARHRAGQFAEVRARLRDDADAPGAAELDVMVAEALRLAEGPRPSEDPRPTEATAGPTGADHGRAASRRRAPVAPLVAAVVVLVLAAVAVVATVGPEGTSEDAAVVPPTQADGAGADGGTAERTEADETEAGSAGAGAEGADAPVTGSADDGRAAGAAPGVPTTAAAAPAPEGSVRTDPSSPPTPDAAVPPTAPTTARVAAMAGTRVTVVVPLR